MSLGKVPSGTYRARLGAKAKKSNGLKLEKYIQVCDDTKAIGAWNHEDSRYDPGVKTKCECDNKCIEGFKNVEFNLLNGDQATLSYFLGAEVLDNSSIDTEGLTVEDGDLKFDLDPEEGLTECYEQNVELEGCGDDTPTIIKNIAKVKDSCDNVVEKTCTEANICCTKVKGKFNIYLNKVAWVLEKTSGDTIYPPTVCNEPDSSYIPYTVTIKTTITPAVSYDLNLNLTACGKYKGKLPYNKKFNWTLLQNGKKIQTGQLQVKAGTDISAYPILLTLPPAEKIKVTDKFILRLNWDNELFSLSDCEKTSLGTKSSVDIEATVIDVAQDPVTLKDIVSVTTCNNGLCAPDPNLSIKPVVPVYVTPNCVEAFVNNRTRTNVIYNNSDLSDDEVIKYITNLPTGIDIKAVGEIVIKYLLKFPTVSEGTCVQKISNTVTLERYEDGKLVQQISTYQNDITFTGCPPNPPI